ncbi:probable flavin-containing monooxygenase 1 [Euphorbia lathyris]|uniref:probable flavin-containing monooxygenase 1 n=1 Tax=Euphorbia lathyris TaxID=212925 RepID=UPI0033135FFE
MEKRVAIIGAGASGLVACKYCLKKGFKPIIFEADSRIGGVWAHTLDSTRLQNTKQVYQFSDFPWHPSVTDVHPTHSQVLDYLESYARHFGILSCISFNSRVIGIDYVGESFEEMKSWDLFGGTGQAFGSKGKWHIKVQDTKNSEIKDYEVEFVILCIGQFSGLPNIPEFPEKEGPEVFKGKVMHSMEFSASKNLGTCKFVRGKKVAVIGSHKSAVDIAAECANINGSKYPCAMVQRSAHWFLPSGYLSGLLVGFLYRSRFAEILVHKPGETVLYSLLATLLSPLRWGISKIMENYIRWKFPLKKHGMLPKLNFSDDMSSCQISMLPDKFFDKVEEGSIIIVNNSQSFRFYKEGLIIDGQKQQYLQTDLVIFATGFKSEEKLKNIFSSSVFQDWIKATSPDLLYRRILNPRIPQMPIVGYSESFSHLGSCEMQSLWLANFLDGNIELPCIRDMEKEAKMWTNKIKQSIGHYYKRACINNIIIWYNDQLCKDLGYKSKRKNGIFADLFTPYAPADYATNLTH